MYSPRPPETEARIVVELKREVPYVGLRPFMTDERLDEAGPARAARAPPRAPRTACCGTGHLRRWCPSSPGRRRARALPRKA